MANEWIELEGGGYRCAWPDCDYTHKKAAGVRLHYYAKHDRERLLGIKKRPGSGYRAVCGQPGCKGIFKLLSASKGPIQARAIEDGWRWWCPECGGLKK